MSRVSHGPLYLQAHQDTDLVSDAVLVKYLDKDYSETKKTLYPLLENRTITFDLMWALFKPNTIVYTTTYNNHEEPRAFKMEYATKESSFMRGQWYTIEGIYHSGEMDEDELY